MKKSKPLSNLLFLYLVLFFFWVWQSCSQAELPVGISEIEMAFTTRMSAAEGYPVSDTSNVSCSCFSEQDLQAVLAVSWSAGWWSDVMGCREEPYDQLMEIWITHAGTPDQKYNLNILAGELKGQPFVSASIFNQITGKYDLQCGGFTTTAQAQPCMRMMSQFITQLKRSHPDRNYCELAPR